LEERVFASVDALAEGLAGLAGDYPILHAQDCISARAACRVRDACLARDAGRVPDAGACRVPGAGAGWDASGGPAPLVVRTLHHVDDFTTQALIDCQSLAISQPDKVLVVTDPRRPPLPRALGGSAT